MKSTVEIKIGDTDMPEELRVATQANAERILAMVMPVVVKTAMELALHGKRHSLPVPPPNLVLADTLLEGLVDARLQMQCDCENCQKANN